MHNIYCTHNNVHIHIRKKEPEVCSTHHQIREKIQCVIIYKLELSNTNKIVQFKFKRANLFAPFVRNLRASEMAHCVKVLAIKIDDQIQFLGQKQPPKAVP